MKKVILITTLVLGVYGCNDDSSTSSEVADPTPIPPVTSDYIENRVIKSYLQNTTPKLISIANLAITDIKPSSIPSIVNLNNIEIIDDELLNNTPYSIDHLYISKGGQLTKLDLSEPLAPYSTATIPIGWNNSEIINSTTLSNSNFDYKSEDYPDKNNYPTARHANDEQRKTTEYTQMYDRFMINAPSTLDVVIEHIIDVCTNIPDYYVDCPNDGDFESYAIDTYYAKSVSGIHVKFWIDDDVWGLAEMPGLNKVSSTRSDKLNLWMHPDLMAQVHSGDHGYEVDGWQALVHEYYHNHGFTHESGWASPEGIDDIFGINTVDDYLINNKNNYITSNIMFNTPQREQDGSYVFNLFQDPNSNLGELNIRLLSTQELNASITETHDNKVRIKFNETPTKDTYVSFYNDDSQQMATIPLVFTVNINSQTALDTFNDDILQLLDTYDIVYVSTKNGAWIPEFHLPSEGVLSGKIIEFQSTAGYDSTIYHDGNETLLVAGDKFTYTFNGSVWELK